MGKHVGVRPSSPIYCSPVSTLHECTDLCSYRTSLGPASGCFVVLSCLGVEPRALFMLGKSSTERHSQPPWLHSWVCVDSRNHGNVHGIREPAKTCAEGLSMGLLASYPTHPSCSPGVPSWQLMSPLLPGKSHGVGLVFFPLFLSLSNLVCSVWILCTCVYLQEAPGISPL